MLLSTAAVACHTAPECVSSVKPGAHAIPPGLLPSMLQQVSILLACGPILPGCSMCSKIFVVLLTHQARHTHVQQVGVSFGHWHKRGAAGGRRCVVAAAAGLGFPPLSGGAPYQAALPRSAPTLERGGRASSPAATSAIYMQAACWVRCPSQRRGARVRAIAARDRGRGSAGGLGDAGGDGAARTADAAAGGCGGAAQEELLSATAQWAAVRRCVGRSVSSVWKSSGRAAARVEAPGRRVDHGYDHFRRI
eukprot:360618-Chlamydomonas_euryale.AAC.7